MIGLDSRRWRELRDAYDPATHIPAILKRLDAGDRSALGELYDAFSLVIRGEISDAAFAAIPHVEAIARTRPLDDRHDLLVFAGRVAHIGLANCAWMDDDVRAPCLAAFARLAADARTALAAGDDEDDAYALAKTVLGFEDCPIIYDAVASLARGEVEVRCPADACGVPIQIARRDSRVEPAIPPATDRDAPWSDDNALQRVVALLRTRGPHPVAAQLSQLLGTIACPTCSESFSIHRELLEPTDF